MLNPPFIQKKRELTIDQILEEYSFSTKPLDRICLQHFITKEIFDTWIEDYNLYDKVEVAKQKKESLGYVESEDYMSLSEIPAEVANIFFAICVAYSECEDNLVNLCKLHDIKLSRFNRLRKQYIELDEIFQKYKRQRDELRKMILQEKLDEGVADAFDALIAKTKDRHLKTMSKKVGKEVVKGQLVDVEVVTVTTTQKEADNRSIEMLMKAGKLFNKNSELSGPDLDGSVSTSVDDLLLESEEDAKLLEELNKKPEVVDVEIIDDTENK